MQSVILMILKFSIHPIWSCATLQLMSCYYSYLEVDTTSSICEMSTGMAVEGERFLRLLAK